MKIDIMNINNAITTTQKSNTKTSKDYDSFDRLFARASYSIDKRSSNNDIKDIGNLSSESKKTVDSYRENSNNQSKVEDDSTKPVSKEIKDELKKAGMSDEEVEKINSLQDLKEKVEPDKLISILLSLMNLNNSNLDLSNLKTQVEEQVKGILNSSSQEFGKLSDQEQLKNKLIDGLFEKVSNMSDVVGNNQKVDLLSKIQSELSTVLSAALKDALKDMNGNEKDSKDTLDNLKFSSKNLNGQSADQIVVNDKDGDKSQDSSSTFSGSSKTEDSFLKNLLSNDNDKISRVTSFMSHLNNMKVDNGASADLEKVIINKNTINSDIIKAFKFMQTNSMKDLTVKIMPKELGEVVINLTMEGGAMKASITAANKEAYNLLNSNLADITNKLQNNDIKIQALTLNIYNEDTTFFKNGQDRDRSGNGEHKGRKNNAIGTIGEDINEIDNLSEVDSNVDMLA